MQIVADFAAGDSRYPVLRVQNHTFVQFLANGFIYVFFFSVFFTVHIYVCWIFTQKWKFEQNFQKKTNMADIRSTPLSPKCLKVDPRVSVANPIQDALF